MVNNTKIHQLRRFMYHSNQCKSVFEIVIVDEVLGERVSNFSTGMAIVHLKDALLVCIVQPTN